METWLIVLICIWVGVAPFIPFVFVTIKNKLRERKYRIKCERDGDRMFRDDILERLSQIGFKVENIEYKVNDLHNINEDKLKKYKERWLFKNRD